MTTYLSTCISGVQEYVAELLQQAIPNVTLRLVLDGLLVYETDRPTADIKTLRCVNNSFVVFQTFTHLSNQPIQEMARALGRDHALRDRIAPHITPAEYGKTFRLITSRENQLVALDNQLRIPIEQTICGIHRLKVNRSLPHIEFWLLARSEGYGFFLKRLTRHTTYEKILEKGELRPELAHIMCALSEPDEQDIVLDPFCGSGAIPLERAAVFPYHLIFACDQDATKIQAVKRKVRGLRKNRPVVTKQQSALHLEAFETGFIHKIITDPPWGFFNQQETDLAAFYEQMLREFLRVLKPNGTIVLLTARKAELEGVLATHFAETLHVVQQYHILVSGKKAAIYKMLRRTEINAIAKRNT